MRALQATRRSRAARFVAVLAGASTPAGCARRGAVTERDARINSSSDARDAQAAPDAAPPPSEPGEYAVPLQIQPVSGNAPIDAHGRTSDPNLGWPANCPAREPRVGARCAEPASCAYDVYSVLLCPDRPHARWLRTPLSRRERDSNLCPARSPLAGDSCGRMLSCGYAFSRRIVSELVCTRASTSDPWRWRWAWDPLANQCAGPEDSDVDQNPWQWKCVAHERGYRWAVTGPQYIGGPLSPPTLEREA